MSCARVLKIASDLIAYGESLINHNFSTGDEIKCFIANTLARTTGCLSVFFVLSFFPLFRQFIGNWWALNGQSIRFDHGSSVDEFWMVECLDEFSEGEIPMARTTLNVRKNLVCAVYSLECGACWHRCIDIFAKMSARKLATRVAPHRAFCIVKVEMLHMQSAGMHSVHDVPLPPLF